jgi:hypothetical protein
VYMHRNGVTLLLTFSSSALGLPFFTKPNTDRRNPGFSEHLRGLSWTHSHH